MSNVLTFQSYGINRYTFYTEAQDRRSMYQNSGATLEVKSSRDGPKCRYYGVIEEIWELDYTVTKIPMFWVRWVPLKDVITEDHNFTTVIIPPPLIVLSKHVNPKEEPFILAKQVAQVFYIRDPMNKKHHVVRKGKRSIVGVDGVVDEEDYDQFDDQDTDHELD